MPAPTSYTETTLKQFIVDELGATGVALSLTTISAPVVQAVYAVERLLSVADVADLTDMAKLEALARWQAWRAAKGAASGSFDVKSGTSDVKVSQRWDHIAAMLEDAEAAASRYPEAADAIYGAGGTATVSGMSTSGSPYAYPCPGGW